MRRHGLTQRARAAPRPRMGSPDARRVDDRVHGTARRLVRGLHGREVRVRPHVVRGQKQVGDSRPGPWPPLPAIVRSTRNGSALMRAASRSAGWRVDRTRRLGMEGRDPQLGQVDLELPPHLVGHLVEGGFLATLPLPPALLPVRHVHRQHRAHRPVSEVARESARIVVPELGLRERRERPGRAEVHLVSVDHWHLVTEVELDAVHPVDVAGEGT